MDNIKGAMTSRKSRNNIVNVVLFSILTNISTSVGSLPLLFPVGNSTVTVYSSLTMECKYAGLLVQQDTYIINWLYNRLFQGNVNKNCKIRGELNTTTYNVTCPTENQHSITINRINLTLHDTHWVCELVVNGTSYKSNTITINVNVPVTSVTLRNQTSNPKVVLEGVPTQFECKSSPCRPNPTILWYKVGPNGIITEQIKGTIALTYVTADNNLTITTSTLFYNASRKDSGYKIYCSTGNDDSPTITSLEQQMNVLYGPTQMNISCLCGKTHHVIDNNSVDLINGDTVTLICSSNGNPQPNLTWNGQPGGNVTIKIEQNDLVFNCTASTFLEPDYGPKRHMMDSKKVRIIRQYAPVNEPTITYTFLDSQLSGKVKSAFSVVENSSFVLTCGNSSSVPAPIYQWNEMNSQIEHLNVKSIKKSPHVDTNGTSYHNYTCKVINSMENTCGDQRTQIGTLEFTQRVNVLYATVLDTVPDRSVLEGDDLPLTATIIDPGSPKGTYKWIYPNKYTSIPIENSESLSQTLHNISRSQAGFYTFQATNQIAPTGIMPYNTEVNQTFYLNVFYPSTVSLFHINEQDVNCTVNENTTVFFVCGVDSNPLSFVYIHAKTYYGESNLTEIGPPKEEVQHTLQMATCYDSGIYRCIGQNDYTSKPVFLDNRLFVRCTPRPRYDVNQTITFYKALGSSVTLNLTLIAFPEPPPESFRWAKIDGENTTELINNTLIQIRTTGLATNLTIHNLERSDFGQYRLLVNRTYTHLFYISPQDIPQMPTHLRYVEEHLTATSAVVKWRPGFDGGLQQTFYILYKTKSDSTWSTTNEDGSNATLRNLMPATFYKVKMFASNSKGNSSVSDVLNITTKEGMVSLPIAVIAGTTGCAAALIVVVIVVVYFRIKRRAGQKTDQGRQTLKNDDPIYDADGMERNMAYESAEGLGFQQPSTSSDVYALVNKSMNKVDESTYAVVDKSRKTVVIPTGDSDVYTMPIKKKADKKAKKGKKGKKGRGGNKIDQNTYENAHELRAVKTNESPKEIIYETGEEITMPKRNVNKDGLLYADLDFASNNKGQKKLVIRGLENATDYVEVDFSKKAEPLPESDGEGDIA